MDFIHDACLFYLAHGRSNIIFISRLFAYLITVGSMNKLFQYLEYYQQVTNFGGCED